MGRVRGETPGQNWSGRLPHLCSFKENKVFSCVESLVNTFPGFSLDASLLPSLNKGENIESEKQGQLSSISKTCVLLISKISLDPFIGGRRVPGKRQSF